MESIRHSKMQETLSILIEKLSAHDPLDKCVIPWSCPVPSFGNVFESQLATVGINPSNREFVDREGNELAEADRRFHTLNSLGLNCWSDACIEQLYMIEESCNMYFLRNPYNNWFRDLDDLISGTCTSYYTYSSAACHLDLIPYATTNKWTDLSSQQRTLLLNSSSEILGLMLRDSPVRLLVLNGKSVVGNMERLSGQEFKSVMMPRWTLPRRSGNGVTGYAYVGFLEELGGVNLGKQIPVLGYNHNLQSSFGVTKQVKLSIRKWITGMAERLDW